MPYFTLQPTKGYFRASRELDATLKSEAETFADLRVNLALWNWDRTTWTGDGIPTEVSQAAEMLASGKYLEKAYATGNPIVNGESLARKLLKDGEALLTQIIDQGGPIDPDDSDYRLPPIKSRPMGRSVRIHRG